MNEDDLLEKLERVEALLAGATTIGEKTAAEHASKRLQSKLQELRISEEEKEHTFTFSDVWSRKLFLALLRRYKIAPFRYPEQDKTTIVCLVPSSFVEDVLWVEFEAFNKILLSYLDEVTSHVISTLIHEDSSEAPVLSQAKAANS